MSGFEVAGIVLGGLPIIVSGLKFYVEGASTFKEWRRYQRPLQQLIAELETSHVILQNILEKLLLGVARDEQIDDMIRNPFGPVWKQAEIHHKVREKLWRNPKVFEETVQNMGYALDELRSSLQIGSDGTVEWLKSTPLKREWKRIRFILQKDNYQNLLTEIRDGISRLQSLTNLNQELQPERRRRSQGRMLKIVRNVSRSIYQAVQMTLGCACPAPHEVGFGLKLLSKPESVIPEDNDEDITRALSFHVVASYQTPTDETEDGLTPTKRNSPQWCEMLIRSVGGYTTPASIPITTRPTTTRVSFLSSLTNPGTSQSTLAMQPIAGTPAITVSSVPTSTAATQLHDQSIQAITDVCQLLRSLGNHQRGACCGYIKDDCGPNYPRFGIYPHDDLGDPCNWSLKPLKDLLGNDSRSSTPPLSYSNKVKLACIVASSMLQLHGTPWLSNPPTHDNIFVVRQAGKREYDRAFVRKQLPEPLVSASAPSSTANTRYPGLFALGILLVELVLGEMISTPDLLSIPFTYQKNIAQLLDRVNILSSLNYSSAVRRCLESDFHRPNMTLGDERYQTEISNIIGWLEDDLKMME